MSWDQAQSTLLVAEYSFFSATTRGWFFTNSFSIKLPLEAKGSW